MGQALKAFHLSHHTRFILSFSNGIACDTPRRFFSLLSMLFAKIISCPFRHDHTFSFFRSSSLRHSFRVYLIALLARGSSIYCAVIYYF